MEKPSPLGQPEQPRNPKPRISEMIESIKRREAVLHDVRKRIESIPKNANLASIRTALDGIWSKATGSVSPESFTAWEKSEELSAGLDSLLARSSELHDEMTDTEDDGQFLELLDEAEKLDEVLSEQEAELNLLLKQPDMVLLDSIHAVLKSLRDKALTVALHKRHPKKALKTLNILVDPQYEPASPSAIKKDDLASVEYSPFEITFTLTGEAFGRYNEIHGSDTLGVHFKRSPFSLVDGSCPDPEATKRHESVHNLLDGKFLGRTAYMTEALEDYGRVQKSEIEPYRESAKKRLLGLSPTDCLDNLKEEILAELEISENTDFGLDPQRDFQLGPEESGYASTLSFATAGATIRDFIDEAERLADKDPDPEVREFLYEFSDKLKTRFFDIAKSLNTAFAIAKRLPDSERAHDALINLCLMLLPSHYPNLPKLLSAMFGKTECRAAEASYRFATQIVRDPRGGFITAGIPDEIFPQDISTITRHFQTINPVELANVLIEENAVTNLSVLRDILDRLTQIEQRIGNASPIPDIKRQIAKRFFTNLAEVSLNQYLKPLTSIYPELTAKEQSYWGEALRTYVDVNFLGVNLRQNMTVWQIEEWKTKVDWSLFDTLGLGQRLRSVVNETIAEEKEWLAIRGVSGHLNTGSHLPEQPFSSV